MTRDEMVEFAEFLKEKYNGAEDFADSVIKMVKDYRDCRNELCNKCGMYKVEHLGGCDRCRFKEV